MRNKKPCSHSISEQQARISCPFPCAVNRSLWASIKILFNDSKVSKDLKPCFPLLLHCLLCVICWHDTKMVTFSPASSVFYRHLSSSSIYSQTLGSFALVWDKFSTITGLFSCPAFWNDSFVHIGLFYPFWLSICFSCLYTTSVIMLLKGSLKSDCLSRTGSSLPGWALKMQLHTLLLIDGAGLAKGAGLLLCPHRECTW